MEIIVSEEAGVRTLHFAGSWVQGAMRVARPWQLELRYTREMMMPLLWQPGSDWPKRVLLIGLGAGSLVKFLHRHRPGCDLTVVEINPSVHLTAQLHFRFPPESDRLRVLYADGADFVTQTSEVFDLILLDGFDHNARMGRLALVDFYCACAARLSPTGVLVANLLSRRKEFRAAWRHLSQAFNGRCTAFASQDEGNVVAFASHAGVDALAELQDLEGAALQLKDQTGLNLLPHLRQWRMSGIIPGLEMTN